MIVTISGMSDAREASVNGEMLNAVIQRYVSKKNANQFQAHGTPLYLSRQYIGMLWLNGILSQRVK